VSPLGSLLVILGIRYNIIVLAAEENTYMKVHILSAAGSGKTEISAFDQALYNSGVHNFNLIPLSSVIPPGAEIVENINLHVSDDFWGDKLYCVISRHLTSVFGEQAWAGIGWIQTPDGRGLFVEHHGESESTVRKLIDNSLSDMVKYRDWEFGPIHYAVSGIECIDKPVCALVIAAYQHQGWQDIEL